MKIGPSLNWNDYSRFKKKIKSKKKVNEKLAPGPAQTVQCRVLCQLSNFVHVSGATRFGHNFNDWEYFNVKVDLLPLVHVEYYRRSEFALLSSAEFG